MIYKITFLSDDADDFRRVFEADSDATFYELHQAILKSAGYPDDQMTSFFMCNDRWEKEQEVTLVEMGSSFEYDNMVMEATRLSDLIEERGQRLIYIFDPMYERYFFGNVAEILPGYSSGVECVEPTSCSLSANSTIILESSSHPSRVFTVTGSFTASTTCLVISTILSGSLIIPEPAPLRAILLTGHPKLMSTRSAPCPPAISAAFSAITPASTIASGMFP